MPEPEDRLGSPPETPPLLAAGAMVDHYQVLKLLGRGGMGEVYLARDRGLGRRVALKIVTAEALGHAEARDRFLREARITARFNHPHIVTVYGVGQVGEMPYVALEYLEGQTLADRLQEERLGVRNALRVALAIAEALAEAHRHHVLHRDLKPENVFIPRDGRLRVLDFGLAKRLRAGAASDLTGELYIGPEPGMEAPEPHDLFQTHSAGIQGTPHYMGPEQWQMRAGPEADLWAFGMILHELFTGEHPFADLDLAGLWRAATDSAPVRSLAVIAPGLPHALVTLADRCVDKTPQRRPTAAEVVEALQAILHSSDARPAATDSPFRGLLPFHERHAHQFFGRESEVEAFVERLRDVPVLPVVGPSGAGKSSFVQAGVIPRLREHGRWLVLRMRPGATPFVTLASRLASADSETLGLSDFSGEISGPLPRIGSLDLVAGRATDAPMGSRSPRDTVQDEGEAPAADRSKIALAETVILDHGEGGAQPGRSAGSSVSSSDQAAPVAPEVLPPGPSLSPPIVVPPRPQSPLAAELAAQLAQSPNRLALTLSELAEREGCRVLLFVDQLEEVYTLVSDGDTRRAFMRALCTAADDTAGPVRVVFTLRDDFLWRLAQGTEAREVLSRVFVLRPPDAEALVEILTRPLQAVGYCYEDEALPEQMVAEVSGEAAALPLLQFAAQQLWRKRDLQSHKLTRIAYQAVGGVAGALAKHADHTLEALTPAQVALARRILLRLVTAQGTRQVLSESATLEGLGPEAEAVLERLTADRILLPRKGQREAELELVHESLVRTWSRLSRWLEESREERAFLDEASQAATLWHHRGRPDHEVWRGAALAEAFRQAARAAVVPELVHAFLGAGRRLERRRIRSRRALLGAAVGLLALVTIGALLFSVALGRKEREARRQRDRASVERSEALRQRAEAERRRTEALREGARSALARTELVEARAKLRGAFEEGDSVLGRALWWQLSQNPLLWRLGLNAHLYGVAFSPGGKTIAVASAGQTVHLVHSHTGETRVLRGHQDQVYSVTFSSDGRLLASGTWSGEIILWEMQGGAMRFLAPGGAGGGWGLAFSRDGTLLASAGASKDVQILEVSTGKVRATLKGHSGSVYSVAMSPDGRTLATGSTDRTVRLWDFQTGQPRATLLGHNELVTRVAFSPDGHLVASASTDHSVRIWSVETRATLKVLTGHQAAVFGLAFRPDGRLLASAGHDQVIRLWHLPSGRPLGQLTGHQARLWDLSFSPDGRTLATVSPDQELRLWRVDDTPRTITPHGHTAMVMGVAYSPDGSLIASSGQDNTVRLWDSRQGIVRFVLAGQTAPALSVAFDRQGRWLASGGDDRAVRIWDLASKRVVHSLGGHTGPIHSLAFSPSGALLASGSADHSARLWNVAQGTLHRELRGHGASVVSVSFHPDGKTLVTGSSDRTLRRWDARTGGSLGTFTGHKAEVHGVAHGPNGRWVASTAEDGTLRIWDLRTGRNEVLGRHPGRAYLVSIDPSGQRLATSCSDGVARIWDRASQKALELRGHRGEVNWVAFSPDGKHLATTGDDTTVRLWDASTGSQAWRAPLLIDEPPELCTHLGWISLGPDARPMPLAPAPDALGARWRVAVRDRAVLAAAGPDAAALCLVTAAGRLERWDRRQDRLLGSTATILGKVSRLLHHGSGCYSLAEGILRRHDPSGREAILGRSVQAVAHDDSGLLVAQDRNLRVLDAKGETRETHPIGAGVTAVARVGHRLVLGYKDGGLELRDPRPGLPPFSSFEGTPASPVVLLMPGPRGTLVAGYGSGDIGLFSLRTGARLVHARIHGAIQHLRLLGPRLVVASELGQHRVLDLSIFQQPYCDLMRTLWREIPIVWQGGRPRLSDPPRGHRCAIRDSSPQPVLGTAARPARDAATKRAALVVHGDRDCWVNSIYFQENSTAIQDHQLHGLAGNLACLKLCKTTVDGSCKDRPVVYEVVGHADPGERSPVALGMARAAIVKRHYVAGGFPEARLRLRSLGALVPRRVGRGADDRAGNRRVELLEWQRQ